MSENHQNLNVKPLLGNGPTVVNIDASEETPSNTQRLVNQGAEATDVHVNLNRTITYNTAGPTTQRSVRIQAPTLASTAATTIATAATVDIGGAPVAGTNVTITTPLALNVAAGKIRTAASTSSTASANIPVGTAPTNPVDGDIWQTSAGFFIQTGGNTIGPISGTVGDFLYACSLVDQPIGENDPTAVDFDTQISANNITLNGTKIYFDNVGTYKIHFLGNCKHTAGGTEVVDLWLLKDGDDVANSGRQVMVSGNNEWHSIDCAWTVTTTAADQYISIYASASDTDLTWDYGAAQTTPYARPAIPSARIIVVQVVDSSVLISGAINLDGGHPTSIYGGTTAINCGGV